MKRSILVLLVLVLAIAAAGCGGDDDDDGGGDDPQAAADATRAYLTAYGDGDGAAACSHLTEGAQQALEASAAQQGANADCAEILGSGGPQTAEFLKPLIDGIDSEDASIDGDTAEVTIEGANVPVTLENVDGEWLVTEEYVRESFQLRGS